MELPYTICFCRCDDLVLMLYRNKPPNQQRWNGLGGKIQAHETPLACVQREILEEADIDLSTSQSLRFAGIVSWATGVDPTRPSQGMYAFTADIPPTWPIWIENRSTPEGLLCWKPISWVCNPTNTSVVENIPHFLPQMLSQHIPHEYCCTYHEGHLIDVIVHPLPHYESNGGDSGSSPLATER